MDGLQPYTVYAFVVQAVNSVGQSRPSKQSYPAITLMESKYPPVMSSFMAEIGRKGSKLLNIDYNNKNLAFLVGFLIICNGDKRERLTSGGQLSAIGER